MENKTNKITIDNIRSAIVDLIILIGLIYYSYWFTNNFVIVSIAVLIALTMITLNIIHTKKPLLVLFSSQIIHIIISLILAYTLLSYAQNNVTETVLLFVLSIMLLTSLLFLIIGGFSFDELENTRDKSLGKIYFIIVNIVAALIISFCNTFI